MFTWIKVRKIFFMTTLGLGLLAACSDNNSSSGNGAGPADSNAEVPADSDTESPTDSDTGTPIAMLDTSLVRKHIDEGNGCGMPIIEESEEEPSLAKTAIPLEDDGAFFARPKCGEFHDIHLYINARAQVVDTKGKPMAGAKVYEGRCAFDDKSCQYTTNKDGFFYIDSVNFLTYMENYEGAAKEVSSKKAYTPMYQSLQLRVLSADSSLGANIFSSFSKASVVEIDGEQVAELKKISLEPVYSARLYLDSIHVLDDEYSWEFVEENGFGICIELLDGPFSSELEEDNDPYDFYPCQMVTEKDQEKGYVTLYGLPEGTYWFSIGNPNAQISVGSDSLVVTR